MATGNINPNAKLCKADYEERGRLHARNGTEKAPFSREATSWQAKAYWGAYDAAIQSAAIDTLLNENAKQIIASLGIPEDRLQVPIPVPISISINLRQPPPVALPKHIADAIATSKNAMKSMPIGLLNQTVNPDTRLWPAAAQEHVRLLVDAMMREASVDRRVRLIRKIMALEKRHGPKAQQALGFAMNTQAHPDGDITLDDLLSGR